MHRCTIAVVVALLIVGCHEKSADRFGMFMELTSSEKRTMRKFLEQVKGQRVRVVMRKRPEAAQATRELIDLFRQSGWTVDVKEDRWSEADAAGSALPTIVVDHWPAQIASGFEAQLREFGMDVQLFPTGSTITGDLEGAAFEFRVGVDTRKLDRMIKEHQRR